MRVYCPLVRFSVASEFFRHLHYFDVWSNPSRFAHPDLFARLQCLEDKKSE
jgi:hypothetical protein